MRTLPIFAYFIFVSCINGFVHILPFTKINNKSPNILEDEFKLEKIEYEQKKTFSNQETLSENDKYNLNWYVIGEVNKVKKNTINKISIWGKNYAFWNNGTDYFSVDDSCSHRGASLSIGKLKNNNIVCPYHAYEFDISGTLKVVPGLPNFQNTACQNLNTYPVVARNGWLYMNIVSEKFYKTNDIKIYDEPESKNASFKSIFLNRNFKAYGRIVSENSLDVMHIGFVHTFGNTKSPAPTKEVPPYLVGDFPFHYKTTYNYKSGKNSMVKKMFNMEDLLIENEFILPHTTIARVIFGNFVSTVMTFAQPLNVTHTRLFVKTYRNFWHSNDNSIFGKILNSIGDYFTTDMMSNTVMQDKAVVESIPLEKVDGLFNMKYDKIQNVYTSLYKKLIHNVNNQTNNSE
jgi:phenylpropionate dioxygenase-like ring-hydroxylating dioxygenase large terminal subunit